MADGKRERIIYIIVAECRVQGAGCRVQGARCKKIKHTTSLLMKHIIFYIGASLNKSNQNHEKNHVISGCAFFNNDF